MTFSRYDTHHVVLGELVRNDGDFHDQWNDWKENRAYRNHLNRKYSPGRLFTEALASSLLLALIRWEVRGLFPEFFPDWLNLASQITLVFSIGFGAIAALAAFASVSDGLNLFHGGTSDVWKLNPVQEKPALKAIGAQEVESTSNKPPTLPCFMLELLVPRRNRATLIGDLEEGYTYDLLPRYGRRAAAFWYWIQCMREILFYLWPLLKKGLPWGIIAASAAKSTWLSEVLHQITK